MQNLKDLTHSGSMHVLLWDTPFCSFHLLLKDISLQKFISVSKFCYIAVFTLNNIHYFSKYESKKFRNVAALKYVTRRAQEDQERLKLNGTHLLLAHA
jgi:hypothetical protein